MNRTSAFLCSLSVVAIALIVLNFDPAQTARFSSSSASSSLSTMSSSSPSSASLSSLLLSIFASDSLALGAHWEYNSDIIRSRHTQVTTLLKPTFNDYHKTKEAGDFTHYGDTAVILLESLAKEHKWDQNAYLQHWLQRWETLQTTSYYDSATKTTYNNLKSGQTLPGAASEDLDLGHVAKLFPLLLVTKTETDFVSASKQLISSSQKSPHSSVSAEFFARFLYRVLTTKQKPSEVLPIVVKEINNEWLSNKVKQGLATVEQDDEIAIRSVGEEKVIDHPTKGKWTIYTGKSCSIEYGIPGIIHFIVKYQDAADPTVALYENTTVGGNTAGRNLAISAVLYAYRGTNFESIQKLVGGLTQKKRLEELIGQVQA